MRESLLAKLLRYAIYLVAFVPLVIFSQYISPFHFGKVIVFRTLIEIMAVGYLLLIWRDRSYLPRGNIILWSLLAFTGAFSISTVFGVQQYFSFWGTLERMGGLWTFWHYIVFFFIATSVLKTREHWHSFLNFTLIASMLSAFYGFGQKTSIEFFIGSGGRERIFGTIGNAALFAGYELVNVFLALTLFFRPENTSGKKMFFATAVIVDSIAVIMTVVRGSVLGLGVGLTLFTVLYYLNFNSKRAKRLFLSLVVAIGIFFLVLITPIKDSGFIQGSRFLLRITDTSFDTYTAKTRFWAWQAGLEGWKDTPKTMLVGWGPESFNIPFSKYFNPKFFAGPGSETFFDRAHNMFVEILVTMGLVGFLTYIAIFWASFRALRRVSHLKPADKIYKIGFIPLLVAYVIHNSFIFDTSANLIVFFTILSFIAFLELSSKGTTSPKPTPLRRHWLQVPTTILLIFGTTILIYRTNIRPSQANYATTRAIIQGWSNNFNSAVIKFRESLSYDVPGKYEYRNRFAQYILEQTSGKDLTPEMMESLEFAIKEVEKNVNENPKDYLPLLYLSRLHIVLGKEGPNSAHNNVALNYSLRALEISPTFVRTYYEVAQAYLNKQDLSGAVSYFKQASELNPDVGLSFWYWGVTEYERGNKEAGLKIIRGSLLKPIGGFSESDYLRMVNIFIEANDYSTVVKLYETLVGLTPQNPRYHASLAVAYARIGQIDKAVASARKAAQVDPTYGPDAEAFIRSLGRQP